MSSVHSSLACKSETDKTSRADEEIDGLRTNAYNKALSVKDEFFHFELYEWYLSRGMTNQLLEVRGSFSSLSGRR